MINYAIIEAIEDLFVVTGRANAYSNYTWEYEDGHASEFSYDLKVDERMYVMCYAQIAVYSKIRTQYTNLLGYTTNALTVTNADKPYAYITGTINDDCVFLCDLNLLCTAKLCELSILKLKTEV